MKTKSLHKIFLSFSLFALMGVLLMGCSKDENPSPDDPNNVASDVFIIDGVEYNLNLTYLTISPIQDFNANMGVIIITGEDGSTVGALNLPVAFALGGEIEGTYDRSSDVLTPGAYIGYMANYSIQNGSELTNGNNPTGFIKVSHHEGDEYTVEFKLVFSDGVEASGKVRAEFAQPDSL